MTCLSAFAQIEDSEESNFLVEFEKFEPAVKDVIKSLEGATAMPFLAPDINGVETFLGDYKGQIVFIYFFNRANPITVQHVASLNLLQSELTGKLKIISIGEGTKEEMKDFALAQGIEYSVLYKGRLLGEAAYGMELGNPRLFVVDKNGKISHVIPEAGFSDPNNTYLKLMNLFNLVNNQ